MTFSVKFYDARDITPRAAKNIIVFYFLFLTEKLHNKYSKCGEERDHHDSWPPQDRWSAWEKCAEYLPSLKIFVTKSASGGLCPHYWAFEKNRRKTSRPWKRKHCDSFLKNLAELILWYTDWGWVNFPISNYHYSKMKQPKVSFWPWHEVTYLALTGVLKWLLLA